MRRAEPYWLTRIVIDAIHHDQLGEHGGMQGARDENLLESALARPRNKWHLSATIDLPALAAAYAFGLVRNHPYRDGNKRIGFLAMVTFLELNRCEFDASDADVVAMFVSLADGSAWEASLTKWVRAHTTISPP